MVASRTVALETESGRVRDGGGYSENQRTGSVRTRVPYAAEDLSEKGEGIVANGTSISEALVDFLRESGLEQSVMDVQIEEVWPRVMGETVQRLTRRIEVRDGVLYVYVNSAALKTQLFENRFELIRKLNEAVGAPALKDCRILG